MFFPVAVLLLHPREGVFEDALLLRGRVVCVDGNPGVPKNKASSCSRMRGPGIQKGMR